MFARYKMFTLVSSMHSRATFETRGDVLLMAVPWFGSDQILWSRETTSIRWQQFWSGYNMLIRLVRLFVSDVLRGEKEWRFQYANFGAAAFTKQSKLMAMHNKSKTCMKKLVLLILSTRPKKKHTRKTCVAFNARCSLSSDLYCIPWIYLTTSVHVHVHDTLSILLN